ncbi:hypothetical protein BKA65DRAFT_503892 [Rhexocercosporidium sp. MPI-PUGE-AT-0058]|nr:hypothetical protein BKA65DRAFT_503892 [Rhexocercosporidium sp. MPI-PUGE-AT-0058]
MVMPVGFLLLNLGLFSHVYANGYPPQEAVRWLEPERSVLIHLATPDLFFWNQRDQSATHYPGAFIFNFTLTPDNRTLLLNSEPILPRASPYIPTPLRAHQIPISATAFAQRASTNYTGAPVMDLDYYIETPDTTSGTSIYNTRYNPRIRFDILRARIPGLPGYSVTFPSNFQKQIWLHLDDLSTHPPNTPYSTISLAIRHVTVDERWLEHDSQRTGSQGTTTYKALKSLPTCYIWSWLCEDIDDYPYYEFIYLENFDQYGKKGSMRHFFTRRWGNLVGLLRFWHAVVFLAVCGSMVLSSFVYAVSRGVKVVIGMYRDRIQEVDDWVADEEIKGLLMIDRYYGNYEEVKKTNSTNGEEDGKTSAENSLPQRSSPRPDSPMQTEKSSTS